MKKRNNFLIVMLLISATLITLFLSIRVLQIYKENSHPNFDYYAETSELNKYSRTIKMCGDSNFAPFTYLDENHMPSGSTVELMTIIAKNLGYNLEISLGDWGEMFEDFKAGNYDFVLCAAYTNSRVNYMKFLGPIAQDSMVFFKTADSNIPSKFTSESNVTIGIIKESGEIEKYIIPMGLSNNTKVYSTLEFALEALKNGRCDVLLSNYFSAMELINKNDYNIVVCSNELIEESYYLGFRSDDKYLSSLISHQIDTLSKDGTIDQLNSKWKNYASFDNSLQDFYEQSNEALIITTIIILLIICILIVSIRYIINRANSKVRAIDHLTGLPSLNTFSKYGARILKNNADQKFVLVRANVDSFKVINSEYGTNAGDELLKKISDLISNLCASQTDQFIVTRISADHFAFLLPEFTFNPTTFIQTLTDELDNLFSNRQISIRFGIVKVDKDTENLKFECDNALLALDSIKDNLNFKYAYYEDFMHYQMMEENKLLTTMHKAIENNEFIVYYQPQYNYITRDITGVEALIRWQTEEGLLSPAKFIPVFEKSGLIHELDKYVWERACKDLRTLRDAGINISHISVNLSRHDLDYDDLLTTLLTDVTKYELKPHDLHLEITETAYMTNPEGISKTITHLQNYDFLIEMDDFGSGYSSLSILKDSPFDYVKLDTKFLGGEDKYNRAKVIVSHIIHLLKDLGLNFLTEGIETVEQADFLKDIGCYIMQGYLFCKPLPLEKLKEELLKAQSETQIGMEEI